MMAPTGMERTPFAATSLGALYDSITNLPAVFILENLRSLYNVGSILRTADAVRLQAVRVVGITADPDHPRLAKTALGAERTVRWQRDETAAGAMDALRAAGFEIVALDTLAPAVDLFDWTPRFPVGVVFGNEVDGVRSDTVARADLRVRIPMLGTKHSLNVATAAGVVAFELLRRYRDLCRP